MGFLRGERADHSMVDARAQQVSAGKLGEILSNPVLSLSNHAAIILS